MADYYELLGITREADADEIKRAYRRLAREHHPDANPDDAASEHRFKELASAYEVLSDPTKRAQYDRFGPEGVMGGDPFAGADGFGDIFETIFGGSGPFGSGAQRGPVGPPRGPNVETSVTIDFADAVFGATVEVSGRTAVDCAVCSATGAAPGTSAIQCTGCGGTGEVRSIRNTLLGQMMTSGACNTCGGSGREIAEPCDICKGDGRVVTDKVWDVDIPAGVDEGLTVKLSGEGAVGTRGGPPGDLLVGLRVRPHDSIQRQGNDLLTYLDVPVTQALLGATVVVDSLDGPEEIEMPRGTESGSVFRVRGHGVPRLRSRGRGDFLVVTNIDVPEKVDEESERLLRELAEHRGESVAPARDGFMSKIRSTFS